jgi:hypothetical protein
VRVGDVEGLVQDLGSAVLVVFEQREEAGTQVPLHPQDGVGGCRVVARDDELVCAVGRFCQRVEPWQDVSIFLVCYVIGDKMLTSTGSRQTNLHSGNDSDTR